MLSRIDILNVEGKMFVTQLEMERSMSDSNEKMDESAKKISDSLSMNNFKVKLRHYLSTF